MQNLKFKTMKKKVTKVIAITLIMAIIVGLTLAVSSYKNAGVVATIVGPAETTGTIVSVNFGSNETIVGVDTDGDGNADITAFTNSFLGGDIMKQVSTWSDGETTGYLTQINAFTSIKAKVFKVVSGDGNATFWEKNIPEYVLYRYGKDAKDLAEK